MYHCGVTLLETFTLSFAVLADVLLSRQRTLSQPITFGLIAHDVTPNITCARANLKHVTCSKNVSSLENLRAYNNYALGRFGVIPPSRAVACYQIKIGLKSHERT